MIRKKTKKEFRQQLISDRQLILRNLDKYNHYLSVGYTTQEALSKLKKKEKVNSLEKLIARVDIAINTFGITGISLDGIRITDEVKKYIKDLTNQGLIYPYIKGQSTLRLTHPKVWGI